MVNGRWCGVSTFGQTFLQGVLSIWKAKFTEGGGRLVIRCWNVVTAEGEWGGVHDTFVRGGDVV